jgi:hypothetical protein
MEEVHEQIGDRLAMLEASAVREAADSTSRAIEGRRRKQSWAIDPGLFLLLGPAPDAFACAGVDGYGGLGCERPECCRGWDDALRGSVSAPGSSEGSP